MISTKTIIKFSMKADCDSVYRHYGKLHSSSHFIPSVFKIYNPSNCNFIFFKQARHSESTHDGDHQQLITFRLVCFIYTLIIVSVPQIHINKQSAAAHGNILSDWQQTVMWCELCWLGLFTVCWHQNDWCSVSIRKTQMWRDTWRVCRSPAGYGWFPGSLTKQVWRYTV